MSDIVCPGIVQALTQTGRPLAAWEIAEATGKGTTALRAALRRELTAGRIRRRADDRWELVPDRGDDSPSEPRPTTLRLDADIRERLDAYCAAERRTLNGAVNYLLMRGLDLEAAMEARLSDADPIAAAMKRELVRIDPTADPGAYHDQMGKLVEHFRTRSSK